MIQLKKTILTLALLVTAATGAWAELYLDINGTSATLKWGELSDGISFWYDEEGGFADEGGDIPQAVTEIQTLTIDASCKNHDLESLYRLFSGFNSLKTINNIENLKTEGVTNMRAMFSGCSSLQSLDLSNFNTASVTSMNIMFKDCSSLQSLDLSSFNTASVTGMTSMFSGCSSLQSLDLSSFNTASVPDMNRMFSGCSSLQSLDLSSFNTASVTDMNSMFSGCSVLENIYVGDGWSTQAVTTGNFMFNNCPKLPGYDGSKISYTMAKLTTDGGYLKVKSAASSGPEVAWNKTTKTGTFTMPGGNVFVVPEYYPQAALTADPTAINNVPATTDGAIVKAGTVANIGSTTTAQGTVMYYVSPTALDDAALLALAADKWTADVPTAESLAQGQAYVYYYVRGNDSDTDEENFSDGDILAANALTVTIAAEPTYDVTYAEGTQDADKWTVKAGTDGSFQSLPLKGVKAGTKVKLKYDGDRSMLKGVKAEKKKPVVYTMVSEATAADYGKVVCAAGHLHDAKTAVPDGCTAVGIVGKVTSTGHGLILALKDATSQNWNTINGWTSASYAGTTLKVLPDDDARGTNLTSYTTLGETAVSNWAVGQKSDYEAIFTNLGSTVSDSYGTTYDDNVNAYITDAGGTAITGGYWSTSYDGGNYSWIFSSDYWDSYNMSNSLRVRPVLGF